MGVSLCGTQTQLVIHSHSHRQDRPRVELAHAFRRLPYFRDRSYSSRVSSRELGPETRILGSRPEGAVPLGRRAPCGTFCTCRTWVSGAQSSLWFLLLAKYRYITGMEPVNSFPRIQHEDKYSRNYVIQCWRHY